MKWGYSIQQKGKAALILAVIVVLVLVKNTVDSRNVTELGHSFSSVYEDRLLVESYIFQLSGHLYQKKMMVDNCAYQGGAAAGMLPKINQHNTAIAGLMENYAKTKLTTAEASYFGALQQNMATIGKLERQYLAAPGNLAQTTSSAKPLLDAQYQQAAAHLEQLSGIQVEEGRLLNNQSKKIIAGSAILTQFEVVLLVGLGLMIQVIIFASKSAFPKKKQMPSLN
ncbi:MCP four helix bundle domain-containing protein [Rufibacter sp. LB8]|uniref:MCP four helix bundle domain-containing protein n=1 Tax=Rufibacter sp. LB8 TaxID=2777781 RepID=UPI00178C5419|nr:MCP four helix bundle domain-containing protein [Rufibacter sp. LB8]